jgi:AcrR family transcriptional regulator
MILRRAPQSATVRGMTQAKPAKPEQTAPRRRQPVQLRAEETRARILQKARDAFAELGFEGASIRDIAREAG